MKLKRRVNCRIIDISDLSGGINVSLLPDKIGDTEMQSCLNFMYDVDSAVLKKRGGLSPAFAYYQNTILGTYNDYNVNRYIVFFSDKSVYVSDSSGVNSFIGKLNGSLKPVCCTMGSKTFIASGDTLQCYNGVDQIFSISNAPKAMFCYAKNNRVWCFSGIDSILYGSGIGDGEFWDDNENDDSAATWIQVGSDGVNIIDAVPLIDDTIVFKSNGEIYDLTGEYPDWKVSPIAEDSGVDYRCCGSSIGSGVVFVGRFGLKSVVASEKYGNVEAHDVGDKFDSLITKNYDRPRVWKLERFRSLFISPNYASTDIIVYNYNLKAATLIRFPFIVVDFFENKTGIVVVSTTSMHYMDRKYITDNGTLIPCSLVAKRTSTIYDALLLTMVDCDLDASTAGKFNLTIENLNVSFSNMDRNNIKINYTVPYLEAKITSNDDVIFGRIAMEVTDV